MQIPLNGKDYMCYAHGGNMKNRRYCIVLICGLMCALLAGLTPLSAATTHYVSTTGELEDAFQNAANGDTIAIAAGTYYPLGILKIGDRSLTIVGAGSGTTIIDGSLVLNQGKDFFLGRNDKSDVFVDYVRIAGLTVRNYETEGIEAGKAQTMELTDCVVIGSDDGFHIYVYHVDDANITLSNCVAYGNDNDGFYLSIENSDSVSVTIEGCRSYSNVDDGIQIDIENSNSVSVTIEGCRLHDNDDHGLSIPVTASDAASVTVECCHAYGNGDAGFYFDTENSSDASARYDSCTANNNAEEGFDVNSTASPAFSLTLTNALSYANAYGIKLGPDESPDNGLSNTQGTTSVANCTIYGNEYGLCVSSQSGWGPGTFVANCIFWGNSGEISDFDGTTTVTYSDIQGGYPGTGNIDADPLFVDAPADLSILQGSPCIDAGTNASVGRYGSVTDDILGVLRPQRDSYDMGAYEYAGAWIPVINLPPVHAWLSFVVAIWENLLDMLLGS